MALTLSPGIETDRDLSPLWAEAYTNTVEHIRIEIVGDEFTVALHIMSAHIEVDNLPFTMGRGTNYIDRFQMTLIVVIKDTGDVALRSHITEGERLKISNYLV